MERSEAKDDDINYSFTKEEIAEFEARRNRRLAGESRLYSWEETKVIITGKQYPDDTSNNKSPK